MENGDRATSNNKQLLDKITSDIEICSVEPKAELDNSLARLNKSQYPMLPRPVTVLSSALTLYSVVPNCKGGHFPDFGFLGAKIETLRSLFI